MRSISCKSARRLPGCRRAGPMCCAARSTNRSAPSSRKFIGEFFPSALARGHSPEKTAEVWELVTGFAGYAFCKAHSTAYGVEAYQSAWLKRYFPAEFMAAVLTNGKGFYDPLVYVLECHRLGLKLLAAFRERTRPGICAARKSHSRAAYPHEGPDGTHLGQNHRGAGARPLHFAGGLFSPRHACRRGIGIDDPGRGV